MCIWDKTEICRFVHIIIIIILITRPEHIQPIKATNGTIYKSDMYKQCMTSTVCVDGKDAHTQ